MSRFLTSHRNLTWSAITSRLTYANVMSTIGVFLALGGGAVAAGGGGNNGGGDKGANHQAGGNGGNGGGDTGGKGDGGNSHGHKGGNGGNGGNDNGDNNGGSDSATAGTNTNAALNFTTREGDPVKTDPSSDQAVASASCQDGETLVGGGVRTTNDKEQVRGQSNESKPMVMSSGPDGNAWSARVMDYAGVGLTATAYAICASSK
jgi:hypothetical protein